MIEDIEVLYIKTANIPRASTLGIQFLGKEASFMKLLNFIKDYIQQYRLSKYYRTLLNVDPVERQRIEHNIMFGNNGTDLY